MQIEDMCHKTRASAIPVVPESEGLFVANPEIVCID